MQGRSIGCDDASSPGLPKHICSAVYFGSAGDDGVSTLAPAPAIPGPRHSARLQARGRPLGSARPRSPSPASSDDWDSPVDRPPPRPMIGILLLIVAAIDASPSDLGLGRAIPCSLRWLWWGGLGIFSRQKTASNTPF